MSTKCRFVVLLLLAGCAANTDVPSGPVSGSYRLGSVAVPLPPGEWQVLSVRRAPTMVFNGAGGVDSRRVILIQEEEARLRSFMIVDSVLTPLSPRSSVNYLICQQQLPYDWVFHSDPDYYKLTNQGDSCVMQTRLDPDDAGHGLFEALYAKARVSPSWLAPAYVLAAFVNEAGSQSVMAIYGYEDALGRKQPDGSPSKAVLWAKAVAPTMHERLASADLQQLPSP